MGMNIDEHGLPSGAFLLFAPDSNSKGAFYEIHITGCSKPLLKGFQTIRFEGSVKSIRKYTHAYGKSEVKLSSK